MSETREAQADAGGSPEKGGVSRRTIAKGVGATLGLGAFAAAVSPLARKFDEVSAAELMQQHYKDLSDDEQTWWYASRMAVGDSLQAHREMRRWLPDRMPAGPDAIAKALTRLARTAGSGCVSGWARISKAKVSKPSPARMAAASSPGSISFKTRLNA